MNTLLIFFLNRSFLDIVEKNQKPVFENESVPPFQIYRLHIRDSDWLNFIHVSGYKIRLVSILRKREDQALILIAMHSKVPSSDHSKPLSQIIK